MEYPGNKPDPAAIMQIGTGFWASKILLTAVHFQLFTKLASGKSMSVPAIKAMLELECTDRHLYDFLDSLTAFGFLQREGLLDTATYSNSLDTDTFLDKMKPGYIGGILEMMNDRLYRFWGNLEEALQSGQPQNEAKDGRDMFAELYRDPNHLYQFVQAMSGIQMGNFMAFAQKFDFSKYNTLTDVGGSSGLLSVMVAKYQAHMHCVSFDLAPVEPIANYTIQQFQMEERVQAVSEDFFNAPIPAADIVVMGNILHDFDEEHKLILMKKAFDVIPDGGAFVAIEAIIDDERKENVFGMMMSLNMLVETGKGFDYTFADFNKWASAVGFTRTELLPLAGPSSAAIAYK